MVTNNEAANALMKLKKSKKPKAKAKAKANTPISKESKNFNRVATAIIGSRSKKQKNNNNKKSVSSNFLQMLFTPRK